MYNVLARRTVIKKKIFKKLFVAKGPWSPKRALEAKWCEVVYGNIDERRALYAMPQRKWGVIMTPQPIDIFQSLFQINTSIFLGNYASAK